MLSQQPSCTFLPLVLFITSAAGALAPAAALGHHSPARYDLTREVVFEGTREAIAPGAHVAVRAAPGRRGPTARALGLAVSTDNGAVYPLMSVHPTFSIRPPVATQARGLAGRWVPTVENGGLDRQKAEAAFDAGLADLASFATKFLSNPDLPHRLKNGLALNPPDQSTFYSADAKGYTDYPKA